MINIEEYPILNHVVTLKCASKDENGGRVEYMTESQVGVINFDKIKEAYAKEKGLKNHPKSNDALYIQQGGIDTFIEFKNGYMEKRKGRRHHPFVPVHPTSEENAYISRKIKKVGKIQQF